MIFLWPQLLSSKNEKKTHLKSGPYDYILRLLKSYSSFVWETTEFKFTPVSY